MIRTGEPSLSIAAKCRTLQVTEQGYYAYCKRRGKPSAREIEDGELAEKIGGAFKDSRQSYGTPRLKTALQEHGYQV